MDGDFAAKDVAKGRLGGSPASSPSPVRAYGRPFSGAAPYPDQPQPAPYALPWAGPLPLSGGGSGRPSLPPLFPTQEAFAGWYAPVPSPLDWERPGYGFPAPQPHAHVLKQFLPPMSAPAGLANSQQHTLSEGGLPEGSQAQQANPFCAPASVSSNATPGADYSPYSYAGYRAYCDTFAPCGPDGLAGAVVAGPGQDRASGPQQAQGQGPAEGKAGEAAGRQDQCSGEEGQALPYDVKETGPTAPPAASAASQPEGKNDDASSDKRGSAPSTVETHPGERKVPSGFGSDLGSDLGLGLGLGLGLEPATLRLAPARPPPPSDLGRLPSRGLATPPYASSLKPLSAAQLPRSPEDPGTPLSGTFSWAQGDVPGSDPLASQGALPRPPREAGGSYASHSSATSSFSEAAGSQEPSDASTLSDAVPRPQGHSRSQSSLQSSQQAVAYAPPGPGPYQLYPGPLNGTYLHPDSPFYHNNGVSYLASGSDVSTSGPGTPSGPGSWSQPSPASQPYQEHYYPRVANAYPLPPPPGPQGRSRARATQQCPAPRSGGTPRIYYEEQTLAQRAANRQAFLRSFRYFMTLIQHPIAEAAQRMRDGLPPFDGVPDFLGLEETLSAAIAANIAGAGLLMSGDANPAEASLRPGSPLMLNLSEVSTDEALPLGSSAALRNNLQAQTLYKGLFCANRECCGLLIDNITRSPYCSKQCQVREQNMRQARVRPREQLIRRKEKLFSGIFNCFLEEDFERMRLTRFVQEFLKRESAEYGNM